jgi:hypothetical protein
VLVSKELEALPKGRGHACAMCRPTLRNTGIAHPEPFWYVTKTFKIKMTNAYYENSNNIEMLKITHSRP